MEMGKVFEGDTVMDTGIKEDIKMTPPYPLSRGEGDTLCCCCSYWE